ncbi:hypothetical protein Q9L58_007526 [Maublancomyces gigas]|uniref:C2H2-type domain-containing protein n=1 Tax=Discina gigas TaxID=1032678 RepID=A0ABR3GDC0_9PEZI
MSRLTGEGGGRGSSGIPPPKTESAVQARKSFYCELCSKGYSRMNEFEAHENSYDHQHKKRFQEMKAMQRDPSTAEKRRERERRQDEKAGVITIKPLKLNVDEKKSGGFKKGGFKSAFGGGGGGGGGGGNEVEAEKKVTPGGGFKKASAAGVEEPAVVAKTDGGVVEESDTEDEGYEIYDPAKPTD